MSIKEEECICTPPDVSESGANFAFESLPPTSRERYICTYNSFIEWRKRMKSTSFSENVLLAYFKKLSESNKPPTLWCK